MFLAVSLGIRGGVAVVHLVRCVGLTVTVESVLLLFTSITVGRGGVPFSSSRSFTDLFRQPTVTRRHTSGRLSSFRSKFVSTARSM